MIEIYTPDEIEQMRPAGAFVANSLQAAKAAAKTGVNLLEIDELIHKLILDAKAKSCYFDYHPSFGESPFGHYICTSVNDAVLHGLPFDYELKPGDLLSLDFAASLNGWVADSAISMIIEDSGKETADRLLITATEAALGAGIKEAKVGRRLGDISSAIGGVARRRGLSVNMEFGGHGVGRSMHQDPHIANDGIAGRGYKLRPGVVIAIEPWFMQKTNEIYQDNDGWTLKSSDGSNGAHSEHTVAITPDGPVILTLP